MAWLAVWENERVTETGQTVLIKARPSGENLHQKDSLFNFDV